MRSERGPKGRGNAKLTKACAQESVRSKLRALKKACAQVSVRSRTNNLYYRERALSSDVGFYLKFQVHESGRPMGCGAFTQAWLDDKKTKFRRSGLSFGRSCSRWRTNVENRGRDGDI